MDSLDLSVSYEKVCDHSGFCLVRLKPVQGVTMIDDQPEEEEPQVPERSVEESISYVEQLLEKLEK